MHGGIRLAEVFAFRATVFAFAVLNDESRMTTDPSITIEEKDGSKRAVVSGTWVAAQARLLEKLVNDLAQSTKGAQELLIDLSGIERLDTVGAWLLDRTRLQAEEDGGKARFYNARPEHQLLLKEVSYHDLDGPVPPRHFFVIDFLVSVGKSVVEFGKDLGRGVSFLGEVVAGLVRILLRPWTFRFPAFVNQLEQTTLRSVPIIALISFLVGCIVAQQGIFQLQRFGAATFVVDLVGILILRELGVLLTSIMIAGRSGSAFTAEIGSMKMREEIDALRVMGLDPVEVLIVPRVLALLVGLPMLTFISSMAALFGGGLIAWIYGGITPDIFMSRLQSAIDMSTFLVGMIKAPFMAMLIGIISALEGMAVGGSAESLGKQVTAAVVKSIFMVIVLDGIFAVFFAAIDF